MFYYYTYIPYYILVLFNAFTNLKVIADVLQVHPEKLQPRGRVPEQSDDHCVTGYQDQSLEDREVLEEIYDRPDEQRLRGERIPNVDGKSFVLYPRTEAESSDPGGEQCVKHHVVSQVSLYVLSTDFLLVDFRDPQKGYYLVNETLPLREHLES